MRKDLAMTSGFSTIAGSVLAAYINLGVPPQNLVTSSVMSIPASIAISKMRIPEIEEPVTIGHVTVDRGDEGKSKPVGLNLPSYYVAECLIARFIRQMLFMRLVRVLYLVLLLLVRFCEHTRKLSSLSKLIRI